jgi:hypothetical protein
MVGTLVLYTVANHCLFKTSLYIYQILQVCFQYFISCHDQTESCCLLL